LFGPYPGASNDLTLVEASEFLSIRLPFEWTLGDAIFACMHIYSATNPLGYPQFLTSIKHATANNLTFDAAIIGILSFKPK
jgi:hypothetical protein